MTVKTLMNYLGMDPVREVIKTRTFGGPYLRFYDFLLVSSYLYEIGAILGQARRSKLNILEKILGTPKKEGELVAHIQLEANNRLHKFGGEPNSLFILFVSTELGKLGMSLTATPPKQLRKAFDEKWPLVRVAPFIEIFGVGGIGFGSYFPELTEKLYRNAHENIDMSEWSKWRSYGLSLSEKPTLITFEEQQQTVLSMVASYTRQYYPEFVQQLDLASL